MDGFGDLNCVYTFDLATEETVKIGTTLVSNQIIFQNRVLSDYSEATGNRVLTIDDFSVVYYDPLGAYSPCAN